MRRLLKLEYLKLRHSRSFWVLLAIYVWCLIVVSFSGRAFLQYLANQGVKYNSLDPTMLPIYDFADIWQNLGYMASFFILFPAFLLLISIANEMSYKTHRQNIIDGLSRGEYALSKFLFAALIAVGSGILLLILGLVQGFLWSPVTDLATIVSGIFFIPAHIFQMLLYMLIAAVIGLWIKRSGPAILILLFYSFIFEPILVLIVENKISPEVARLLPLNAIDGLMPMPFSKYIFLKTTTFIPPLNLLIAAGWAVLLFLLLRRALLRRDFS